MKTQHCINSSSRKTPLRAAHMTAAVFLLGAAPAFAGHIQTTAELADACELSPAHVVVLDHPTKLFWLQQSSPEEVDSACTIVLGNGAKLEVGFITMDFAGPLVIQSAQKTEVKLVQSLFRAPSIAFNLAGTGSSFAAKESTLEAESGSLQFAMGDESKLEMFERLLPGPAHGLSAANMLQVSGGRKFLVVLDENQVRAVQGVSVTMNGGEGVLKIEQVTFATPQGSVAISASGEKNLLAMSESHMLIGDAASVRFAGSGSAIMLKQSLIGRLDGNTALGGVTLEAGSGSAVDGKLELSEFGLYDVGSATILASGSGQQGVLKLEKSSWSVQGDIVLETGTLGATNVKENQLASETRIRIATGPGGSCLAQPNEFFATPIVEACQSDPPR